MAQRIYLNDDWQFTEQFSMELLEKEWDGKDVRRVRLPHTCKETPFHYFDEHIYQMVSGYRRMLFAPEAWRDAHVLLTIDGAAHESEVFLNGEKIGEHHCGYTAFTVDLKGKLRIGAENILVVKVDSRENLNIPPFGHVIDYMTYGGIYRDVYLDICGENYLADVFVHTNVDAGKTVVLSEVSLDGQPREGFILRQSIRKLKEASSENGSEQNLKPVEEGAAVTGQSGEGAFRLLGEKPAHGTQLHLEFPVEQASLWSVEHPALYELRTELLRDGTVLDEKTVTFGFRSVEFRSDGFYLNGEKIKIRGLNRHQSYPYVGYAMPESMQRLDAAILKQELGVNAVRTSHYPQSHDFLDACDRIGLLVFTEIPGWQHIGDEAWKKQAVENVRDMVRQYRNHTSVILWGVRINESQDDDAFYERTNAAAHELDPTRQTGGVRANKKSSLLEDVYTYNDFLHDGKKKGCERKAAVTSDGKKPYLISEYNGHMYPTKAFDWEEHRREHAIRHANVLDAVAGQPDIAGSFGWCMFDYNTHKDFGSGDRICYHGVTDMFRNPKLAAAVYACQQEQTPVLELSSSMDIGEHPGCNRGTTYIFTNADSVRMYKNDHFIKEYRRTDSPYRNLLHGPIVVDDFIGDAIEKNEHFKPAQAADIKKALNAVARFGLSALPKWVYLIAIKLILFYRMKPAQAVELYNRYIGDWGGTSTSYRFEAVKDGKIVKTIVKEPMRELRLAVDADHTVLREKKSYDVALIRIRAEDEKGNLLSFCNDPVQCTVSGPLELIGPETVSLQGGMGGTYVKTTGESGNATLTLHMAGTEDITIEFVIE
ncbi:MAG: glycoside hydrolase family 2 TIM barrel-domain containing protein [Roseburia sp.]